MSSVLQRLRRNKGLTTYEVGEAIGVPQSVYSRIENGKATASDEVGQSIARLLDTSVDMIFTPSRYVVTAEPSGEAA